MIRLVNVTAEQKELLWNIHQKYLYEMTNYYDNDIDESGNIHYGYFDAYFTDPKRTALFLYDDEQLIGFALINPYSLIGRNPDHVLGEFTVFPEFRRHHSGLKAAELILETYPGQWEIKYNEHNTAARALWTRLTEKYDPEKYRYSDCETVLIFRA